MSTKRISVERVSIISRKSLQNVLAKFDAAIGHPTIEEFWKHVAAAKTNSEMEKPLVDRILGLAGAPYTNGVYNEGEKRL